MSTTKHWHKILLIAAMVLPLSACQESSTGSGSSTSAIAAPPTGSKPVSSANSTVFVSRFDASRAYDDLKKQVEFGHRIPNTPAHDKCRDWLVAEFEKLKGVTVKKQDFTTSIRGVPLKMTNIIAQINPDAKKQVMLCAHWDTRPTADMELSATKKKQPIPGANDGASGVAVLLELARVFTDKKPDVGVQLVLWDGEDYGPGLDAMFLGAKYYANKPAFGKPDYAILIDMIGDKDLHLQREPNSEASASLINDKVFFGAKAIGVAAFEDGEQQPIEDDHIPLLAAGWKAIDLIDFNYAPWHTLDDTPDKCSPDSLKAVGDVLAYVVYKEKP